jgi:hypothetical protein
MEQKSIFQVIAEGVATTNQNVYDLYALVDKVNAKIDKIEAALYTTVANEDGGQK